MSAPQIAVVEDLEERRAQLTDGKCIDLVAARMPPFLGREVRQAAQRAGTSVSDWMMQAAIKKIVDDERKNAEAEVLAETKKKPAGISDGHWNERVRDVSDKLATGKKRR